MTHKVQIDDEIRNATEEEAAFIDLITAHQVAEKEEQATKEQAKAALLDRLGITAEEAALLLA